MTTDPTKMDPRSVDTLLAIMKALRTPVTGCPWDLKQSFESIAPYTIEEAYEVADAVSRKDMGDLCEELGDLLFQPVYHAQMAAETGHFTFADVVEAVCTKMIRRHPHVFGDDSARAKPLAEGFWEDAKSSEKRGDTRKRTLDGVALGLPALLRAIKLQNKAAKVGFDWPHVDFVYDKVAEEIAELKSAPPEKRAEEIGDLYFVLANVARHYGIDPEAALRGANAKFERRFQYIEDALERIGKTPGESNLEEMDRFWDAAKLVGL
jgi:nucleoside triphosphate diphosphatase